MKDDHRCHTSWILKLQENALSDLLGVKWGPIGSTASPCSGARHAVTSAIPSWHLQSGDRTHVDIYTLKSDTGWLGIFTQTAVPLQQLGNNEDGSHGDWCVVLNVEIFCFWNGIMLVLLSTVRGNWTVWKQAGSQRLGLTAGTRAYLCNKLPHFWACQLHHLVATPYKYFTCMQHSHPQMRHWCSPFHLCWTPTEVHEMSHLQRMIAY